jgi:hypothetical protein
MLQSIIVKSYLVARQAAPEGEAMMAEIEAVAEALDGIDTGYLNEYYQRATKRKNNGYAVNALDIIAEWNRLRELRDLDADLKPEYRGRY